MLAVVAWNYYYAILSPTVSGFDTVLDHFARYRMNLAWIFSKARHTLLFSTY